LATTAVTSINGVVLPLDDDALVWHNVPVGTLARRLAAQHPDLHFLPMAAPVTAPASWDLLVVARRLRGLCGNDAGRWDHPLPPLNTMLADVWPCLADIFCADCSSIHAQFRLPSLGAQSTQQLLLWAATGLLADGAASHPDVMDDGPDVTTSATLRETRRRNRSVPAATLVRQRRRGVRRWATAPSAVDENHDAALPQPDSSGHSAPPVVVELLRWLLQSTERVHRVACPPLPGPEAARLQHWLDVVDGGHLVDVALANPMLRSLLLYTVALAQQLGALSSRNETLRWLYTSTVWYLAGPQVAGAYIRHLLLPSLLTSPVAGIPGIARVTIHHERGDEDGGQWYASTEGSNLGALYLHQAPSPPLAINRRRCLTTNVMETHATLGLEAVCWMFSVPGRPDVSIPSVPAVQWQPGVLARGEQRCLSLYLWHLKQKKKKVPCLSKGLTF
jgi:hypothetical protein